MKMNIHEFELNKGKVKLTHRGSFCYNRKKACILTHKDGQFSVTTSQPLPDGKVREMGESAKFYYVSDIISVSMSVI